jgi:hypothetical protein
MIVAGLFALQTAVVYAMLLAGRRKAPARRAVRVASRTDTAPVRVAEDPFPWARGFGARLAA